MSDIDEPESQLGDWQYVQHMVKTRTYKPIKHFPFVVYFIIGVVGCGALGIWMEVIKSILLAEGATTSGIITAVITFFAGFGISTAFILLMGATGDRAKIYTAFAILFLILFVMSAILLSVFSSRYPQPVLVIGVMCSVTASWLWWFTNSDNPVFLTVLPVDASTGGPTNRPLPGDLSDYDL